jgi:alkyl hydroperoxide reductase subunit F
MTGSATDAPYLEVRGEGLSESSRIAFRGVPGGHEFSSLVLSILNGDGKGKLPDAGLVERIRSLQGPVRVRTYVSLSCENCPEVVQAFNVMAGIHSDFHHETIDGAVAQEEVTALGIQGVPSVVTGNELLHSGKSQLIDLLVMLEESFGKIPQAQTERDLGIFDVWISGVRKFFAKIKFTINAIKLYIY